MALKKEIIDDKIEIVGNYKHIQVRTATIVKEGTQAKGYTELSRSFERKVLTPDMDISGESSELQALANAVWTDEIKQSWEDKKNSLP